MSADGRYVVFFSYASNLVVGDTNATGDVFVYDRQSSTTTRVSVSSSNGQGTNVSNSGVISANGQFVVFKSESNDLVLGDTNFQDDIFVHNRSTGVTERVSIANGGGEGNGACYPQPSVSADGRYVAFASHSDNLVAGDTNGVRDIFVRDRVAGTTTRVSVGPGGAEADDASEATSMSSDGRYVAFASSATNLDAGDANGVQDIFVHDRHTGVTKIVSRPTGGAESNDYSFSPALSADGRFIAFESWASNMAAGDTNGSSDIFVNQLLPLGSAISGTAFLLNYVGPLAGETLTIEVYSGVTLVETLTPTLATSGAFSAVTSASGAVTLRFKCRTSLYKSVMTSAPASGINVTLIMGDLNGSGEVDPVDLDMVIAQFGAQGNIMADINGNGEVDPMDIDLILANFGESNN